MHEKNMSAPKGGIGGYGCAAAWYLSGMAFLWLVGYESMYGLVTPWCARYAPVFDRVTVPALLLILCGGFFLPHAFRWKWGLLWVLAALLWGVVFYQEMSASPHRLFGARRWLLMFGRHVPALCAMLLAALFWRRRGRPGVDVFTPSWIAILGAWAFAWTFAATLWLIRYDPALSESHDWPLLFTRLCLTTAAMPLFYGWMRNHVRGPEALQAAWLLALCPALALFAPLQGNMAELPFLVLSLWAVDLAFQPGKPLAWAPISGLLWTALLLFDAALFPLLVYPAVLACSRRDVRKALAFFLVPFIVLPLSALGIPVIAVAPQEQWARWRFAPTGTSSASWLAWRFWTPVAIAWFAGLPVATAALRATAAFRRSRLLQSTLLTLLALFLFTPFHGGAERLAPAFYLMLIPAANRVLREECRRSHSNAPYWSAAAFLALQAWLSQAYFDFQY
jgi:hypothetical protein